jgi:hypothetical protein
MMRCYYVQVLVCGYPDPLRWMVRHVLLVHILTVLGFIAMIDCPLEVVTPSRLNIYVLG